MRISVDPKDRDYEPFMRGGGYQAWIVKFNGAERTDVITADESSNCIAVRAPDGSLTWLYGSVDIEPRAQKGRLLAG